MWFMSLDMASGFWAVRMAERAKLISAFVCPFGHFQWLRMPFGLKNLPLIYQSIINNCLSGFVRLPPEEEALVDQEVLEFLNLEPQEVLKPEADMRDSEITALDMTVFRRNIPAPSQMGPVLGRSSYIDDIAHGASTWDQLCEDLYALLYRLRYWNISVSLPKSEFGKLTIPFLSHEVSVDGIRASPKIVKGIEDLPFSSTYTGVHSLKTYHAVLYELDEERVRAGRNLEAAKESFEILKRKIVSTPLLRHPDRTKPFVIIPHANPWAACAVLGQEHEGLIHPVRFTGRVLKESELRYHIAEKEVLAILRNLEVFRTLIHGSEFPVVVYTRYSVLNGGWNYQDGHWKSIGLRKMRTALRLGSGITPREHLDEVAATLIPAKGRLKVMPPVSLEMLEADYQGYVLSFDGAANVSTRRGSCGCILWKLPGWQVVKAEGHIFEGVTVNDAEYHGLILGLMLAMKYDLKDLVGVGDSRIVVQQAHGLINCYQPNLQRRLAEYEDIRKNFVSVNLIHVKREFNQAADYLTSKTLVLGESWELDDPDEIIPEKIMKTSELDAVRSDQIRIGVDSPDVGIPESLAIAAEALMVMTRSRTEADVGSRTPADQSGYQDERWRRIKVHQDEDLWIQQMKKVLKGDVSELPRNQVKKIAKVSDQFALDSREALYRLSTPTPERPRNKQSKLRLVVPETLGADMLHYSHEDFQGGHQGINRTFERLRSEFYWIGMYADVQKFVRECVDCASAKGRPPVLGPSPDNIEPRCPFEVISMDFVTELPESDRGNTYLLLFQDQFSGYVMCKPMRNTEARMLLRHMKSAYSEDLGRRYLLKSKQRATLGYRPQANGQQERSVQTVMRSVRAYVAKVDQSDWDEHAERLMFALNTSFDAARLDTPFYLVLGWDAQGTISAMLGPKPSTIQERTALEWHRKMQRD
ncbi:reverse transcriptase [Phytophthora megakarya]|uniref:Reverse transcriptase n=1 Tax=Phytophthora megakarya TaxID=4795 RepID=A0A225VK26_9STRA|nr:reverse transcriptase [Phytophthora megakarya]